MLLKCSETFSVLSFTTRMLCACYYWQAAGQLRALGAPNILARQGKELCLTRDIACWLQVA